MTKETKDIEVEVEIPVNWQEETVKLREILNQICDENEIDPELYEPEVVDYTELISPAGIVDSEDGGKFVTLAELRRLGRLKGIVSTGPIDLKFDVEVYKERPARVVNVVWSVTWADGTTTSACADAWWKTVKSGFRSYLTAFASNRAEARALRAGLGIDMASWDEINPHGDPDSYSEPSSSAQHAAIQTLAGRCGFDLGNTNDVEAIIGMSPRQVSSLEELTTEDAIALIGALNKLQSSRRKKAPAKKKVGTKKEKK